MTPTRVAIVLFWLFLGVMLYWQFLQYDKKVDDESPIVKVQPKVFLLKPGGPAIYHGEGNVVLHAVVKQTGYTIIPSSTGGTFTARITLSNKGGLKATGIQVELKPYAPAVKDSSGYRQGPHSTPAIGLDLISQWVEFPDLGPGESASEEVNLISRPDASPSTNPNPHIIFTEVKADP